jgi:alkyl hydroperoxide reductase subunit AhpC
LVETKGPEIQLESISFLIPSDLELIIVSMDTEEEKTRWRRRMKKQEKKWRVGMEMRKK